MMAMFLALPMGLSLALGAAAAPAVTLNNRVPKLIPLAGAWRGAELGGQFLAPSSVGGVGKLASYARHYPATPLQVYRSFNLTLGGDVRAWVKKGGILWYNIKTSKEMSWQTGAEGGFDAEAASWAAQVKSLAPAQVFVVIYHEPDHNICFVSKGSKQTCPKGGVPGNTPAHYRNMYANIQDVFRNASVTNAVWVMDYSVQIANTSFIGGPCDSESCEPAAAVAPLWPGDDRVDWVFFNAFEKGKHDGSPKRRLPVLLDEAQAVIGAVTSSSKGCHCVAGKDSRCAGCDLKSKPWGLGAFAAHGGGAKPVSLAERVRFLNDAAASTANASHRRLEAYLYFDSLDSEIAVNGSAPPALDAAFRAYLGSSAFKLNDAGAPH